MISLLLTNSVIIPDHLDVLQIFIIFYLLHVLLEENLITLTRMVILSQPLNGTHPFSRHNISYF